MTYPNLRGHTEAMGLGVSPYQKVLDIWTAVMTATVGGDLLATLKTTERGAAATVSADLRALVIWPEDNTADIRCASGGLAAGAASPKLPTGGMILPLTKELADTLALFETAATANVTVIELG